MAGPRVATCVWRVRPEVVIALDGRFGEPVDTYVNGSQVWIRDDGPGDAVIEWRLHPAPGYRRPDGLATEEVFSAAALAVATGGEPPVALEQLWDGLEAFPAYGDAPDPADLSASCAAALGISPDASGLADHDAVGDEWERARGAVSITELLLAQLQPPAGEEGRV